MTPKSLFKATFLLLTLLNLHHAVAGNGTDRGGGDAVLFDDRVVLADPYLKRSAEEEGLFKCPEGTRGDLKPELRTELERIGRILVSYGAYQTKANFIDSQLIQEHVLDKSAIYCFVDELPRRENLLPVILPADAKGDEQVGYTEGKITFLKTSIFQGMNLREQGKTIVHERLHSAVGNIKYGPIADITNGLEVALSLYNEQIQGKTPPPSEADVEMLKKMRASLVGTGLAADKNVRIYPNGGAMVAVDSEIDPTAYIGVTSAILGNSKVGARTVILNSQILADFGSEVQIGEDVQIHDSTIDPVCINNDRLIPCLRPMRANWEVKPIWDQVQKVSIKNRAVILRSNIDVANYFDAKLTLGEDSKIESSSFMVFSLQMETKALISRTHIRIDYTVNQDWWLQALSIKMGESASIMKANHVLVNSSVVYKPQSYFSTYSRENKENPLIDINAGVPVNMLNRECTTIPSGKSSMTLTFGGHLEVKHPTDLLKLLRCE